MQPSRPRPPALRGRHELAGAPGALGPALPLPALARGGWPGTLAASIAAALLALGGALALAVATGAGGRASAPGDRPAAAAGAPVPAQTLPVGLEGAISRGIGRDLAIYRATRKAGTPALENPRHGLSARFGPAGLALRHPGGTLGLRLAGYGYGGALGPIAPVPARASANRVSYRHGALVEWYANGPAGIEQGFTLAAAPARHAAGPLTLAMELSGTLHPRLAPDRQTLRLAGSGGAPALSYGGLWAQDAGGRGLPAWLELSGGRLLVRVDDAGARYPIVIDPIIQKGKLTAADAAVGAQFGFSVAVDGDTAVVGAPRLELPPNGAPSAVYVFTRPASGWANATQVAKLTGTGGANLGAEVAISGDTVVAAGFDPGQGFEQDPAGRPVYVFVKPASGWADATETARLTLSSGQSASEFFPASLAISGDTVVAGGYLIDDVQKFFGPGAAHVFVRPTSGWADATETATLTASDFLGSTTFGVSAAISGDTIVIGSPEFLTISNPDGEGPGAAYVFVRPPSGWANATETARLTASDGADGNHFGTSVGISADTVVAGAPGRSAAYVFVKAASGWASATETARLTAPGTSGLGDEVAIAGDTVLASGSVFTKPAAGWANATPRARLIASDGEFDGGSLSVSGDTFFAGTLVFGEVAGAPTPTVTSVGSSLNPSLLGQPVSFTATVEPSEGTATPTGTVQFAVDGMNLGDPVPVSGGSATSPAIDSLGAGAQTLLTTQTLTARYSGDLAFAASTAGLEQTVQSATLEGFAPAEVRAGSDMTLRFQARNLSDAPLRDVFVRADLDSGEFRFFPREELLSFDCGPLGKRVPADAGTNLCRYAVLPAKALVEVAATVSVCCVGAGDAAVTNSASFDSNQADLPPPGSVTTAIAHSAGTGSADLAVKAHARREVRLGRSFQFRAVVRNLGPDPATNVVVSLGLPDGHEQLVSADCAPTPADGVVASRCSFPSLAPGASVAVRWVLKACCALDTSDSDETLLNVVVVSSDADDPDRGNNRSEPCCPALVKARADLALSAQAPQQVRAGDTIDFQTVVKNLGPDPAHNVSVFLGDVPGQEQLVSVDCAPTPVDGVVPTGCLFPSLEPGASVAVHWVFRVCCPQGTPDEQIVNSASVFAETPDPRPGNDAAAQSTTLVHT